MHGIISHDKFTQITVQSVSFHMLMCVWILSENTPAIHLGRQPLDRCASTSITCASCPPFTGKTLSVLQNATLRVRIGPSANERGYMGITGYCNDRGSSRNFVLMYSMKASWRRSYSHLYGETEQLGVGGREMSHLVGKLPRNPGSAEYIG